MFVRARSQGPLAAESCTQRCHFSLLLPHLPTTPSTRAAQTNHQHYGARRSLGRPPTRAAAGGSWSRASQRPWWRPWRAGKGSGAAVGSPSRTVRGASGPAKGRGFRRKAGSGWLDKGRAHLLNLTGLLTCLLCFALAVTTRRTTITTTTTTTMLMMSLMMLTVDG